MDNLRIIFGIFALILSLAFIWGLFLSQPTENSQKDVPCYDRWNNEIKGETCIEETIGIPKGVLIGIASVMSLFTIMMTYVIFWRNEMINKKVQNG